MYARTLRLEFQGRVARSQESKSRMLGRCRRRRRSSGNSSCFARLVDAGRSVNAMRDEEPSSFSET